MAKEKGKVDYKRIIVLSVCYFVVLLLVGVLVFSFVVFSIAKTDEEAEGVVCRTIADDRLAELDIDAGDFIIAPKIDKSAGQHQQIQVGDVITFLYFNSEGEELSVTAQVTHIIEEPNSMVRVNCYKVSGQVEYVHPNQIEAVYVIGGETVGKLYKGIGSMLDFMRSGWGYVLFVVVPAVLSLGIIAITIFYDIAYNKNKIAQPLEEEQEQEDNA